MPEPIFERLAAATGLWGDTPRRARRRAAPQESAPAADQLVSELEMCAEFADGTVQGLLVPLANFTRLRMARALRAAASALRRSSPAPRIHEGHLLDRVEAAIAEVLADHGIPTSVRHPHWRAEEVARVAARHAIAETLAVSRDRRNLGIERIASERARQIHEEGHDPTRDIGRSKELMRAAGLYLEMSEFGRDATQDPLGNTIVPGGWPWADDAWKPSEDVARNLEIWR